ncbi:MAG TPA: alkaline phosphatase family protein [Acidimicrobiales bacterium]|nr:alkaline phosphatase family protein [Acidimicrobiales bacterium]
MTVEALLIGVDGATFTVLDPLMARGVMPFLAELTARGTRAPLRTVMPPLTPPGWTSMMTGKRPGQHGVFDFFQKESVDSEYFRFTNSQDIQAATIWSLASDYDKSVIALNFPLMFPPPAVKGCIVPGGWMPWRQLRLGCHPDGLFDRLKTLPSFNPRELSLDMTLEAKAIEGCPEEEYADWIELHIRREERWFEIASYLMREEPAELVGVMFDGVDKLQHLCWRFVDPACQPLDPSPWEARITALCERYFRRLDEIIAELVAMAGPDALTVVGSDHGFGPTFDVFYLNSWLAQQGYLAWADEASGGISVEAQIGFTQMTRHISDLDWKKTLAYVATPSSSGIHIVAQDPAGGPLPTETRARITDELAAALAEVRRPDNGKLLVSEIHTRVDAFAGPFEQYAPDISVIFDGGTAVSILRSEELIRGRPLAQGGHRWEGVFVASGPAVRRGAAIDEVSITDVAPLLLYALDLPVPDDMSGVIPAAVFEDGQMARRPARSVTTAAAAPIPMGEDGAVLFDDEDEATILSRLRALGYVE